MFARPYRPGWACLRYRRRPPNDLSNSHAAERTDRL